MQPFYLLLFSCAIMSTHWCLQIVCIASDGEYMHKYAIGPTKRTQSMTMSTEISSANATCVCCFVMYKWIHRKCVYTSKRASERSSILCTKSKRCAFSLSHSFIHSLLFLSFRSFACHINIHIRIRAYIVRSMVSSCVQMYVAVVAVAYTFEMLVSITNCDQVSYQQRVLDSFFLSFRLCAFHLSFEFDKVRTMIALACLYTQRTHSFYMWIGI